MAEVVSLKAEQKPAVEPQKEIIETLELLLSEAKSGQLQGFAYTAEHLGGNFVDDWMGSTTVFALLGAIQILSRSLEDVILEENE